MVVVVIMDVVFIKAPLASLYLRNSTQENKPQPLTTKTVQQSLFVNAPSVT